jgi:hypothetical protein
MRSNASAALKGRRRRAENMVAICVMAAAFILRRPSASRVPAHDPEKWFPVFGKDHAPAKC